MALATLHETEQAHIRQGLACFNHAVDVGGLANGDILNLTTVAGLKTAITGLASHEANAPFLAQAADAQQTAKNIGLLTDTNIAAADTLAGVRSLYTTEDTSLDAAERRSFAFTSQP